MLPVQSKVSFNIAFTHNFHSITFHCVGDLFPFVGSIRYSVSFATATIFSRSILPFSIISTNNCLVSVSCCNSTVNDCILLKVKIVC